MIAVGIVRQSRGRDESLSPAEQRERIEALCEREGFELAAVHEEIDVSGFKTPLHERHGLSAALHAIEDGTAQVLVVAYFDRLFRRMAVQAEVVARVEAAGGRVLTADMGEISEATAAQWISGTMLGVVSEYYARSARERSSAAQRMAVAEGRPPFGSFPPGLVVGDDGRLMADASMPVVAEAFRLRAGGATIKDVRAFLRSHGIERSYHGVQSMLRSRLYLGELRFGDLCNLDAHPAVIDRALWDAVQTPGRGPRTRSDRLLARLGVLRCGSCGARMVVGAQTQGGRRYPFYRCPPVGDCERRVTIGAEIAEEFTVEQVRSRLAAISESAGVEQGAAAAERRAEAAQVRLDTAIATLADLDAEPAALATLRELRDERDRLQAEAHRLGDLRTALVLNAARDWGRLGLDARRELIRAVVERVTVGPGRGTGRLAVTFRE